MPEGLSAAEAGALAELFGSDVSARQLLEAVGLRRSRHPVAAVGSAHEFWCEVARLLELGAVPDGRKRLLVAVRQLFPAHPVLAAAIDVVNVDDAERTASAWQVPWPRNPHFIGREAELAHVRSQLCGSTPAVSLPLCLYGLGGVGKTQLAVEHAFRYRAEYAVVWWVDAEYPGAVVASLAELARLLGIAREGEASESARRMVDALAAGDTVERWLVVVDNAPAPSGLSGLSTAARSGGHVLVTSRHSGRQGVAKGFEVDLFHRHESVALLKTRSGRLTAAEANEVADLLGDLPLALEQAAAWLAATAMAADRYYRLVVERSRTILGEGKPLNYPMPVAATWLSAVDQLDPAIPPRRHSCGSGRYLARKPSRPI